MRLIELEVAEVENVFIVAFLFVGAPCMGLRYCNSYHQFLPVFYVKCNSSLAHFFLQKLHLFITSKNGVILIASSSSALEGQIPGHL